LDNSIKAKIIVYNSLGETIEELFNGEIEAGKIYSVSFDGNDYSSGVYYYKLITPERIAVKKMLLVK